MEETKIIYHIDDEETPYLVKVPLPPERVTLADFKKVINRPNFKSSSSRWTMISGDIETTSFLDSEDETTSPSSISSITDSTLSLNIITVTLNLDTVNFLGISIVGQSNKGGDGGIYVGSIMKGPIKLVVAKCWDPNPKGYFTIPRTEPVRPIDPGAWVAHTEAARGSSSAVGHSRLRWPLDLHSANRCSMMDP
ncbi:hypothetical protein HPB49_026621 [Dermacentor silvarum]|nr:hypothetical protein HPB49_026621 [Dermacentor silvarum]